MGWGPHSRCHWRWIGECQVGWNLRPLSVPFLIRTSGESHSQAGLASETSQKIILSYVITCTNSAFLSCWRGRVGNPCRYTVKSSNTLMIDVPEHKALGIPHCHVEVVIGASKLTSQSSSLDLVFELKASTIWNLPLVCVHSRRGRVSHRCHSYNRDEKGLKLIAEQVAPVPVRNVSGHPFSSGGLWDAEKDQEAGEGKHHDDNKAKNAELDVEAEVPGVLPLMRSHEDGKKSSDSEACKEGK